MRVNPDQLSYAVEVMIRGSNDKLNQVLSMGKLKLDTSIIDGYYLVYGEKVDLTKCRSIKIPLDNSVVDTRQSKINLLYILTDDISGRDKVIIPKTDGVETYVSFLPSNFMDEDFKVTDKILYLLTTITYIINDEKVGHDPGSLYGKYLKWLPLYIIIKEFNDKYDGLDYETFKSLIPSAYFYTERQYKEICNTHSAKGGEKLASNMFLINAFLNY